MVRFTLAASFVLLGGLFAPTGAIGQQQPGGRPPVGSPAVQAVNNNQQGAEVGPKAEQAFAEVDSLRSQELSAYWQRVAVRAFDALETNFGLKLSDADDALRSQLEIPPGEGVVVVGVKPGSLAEHAGLKTNDVLLSLGDQKAKAQDQVRDLLLGLGKEAVEVRLIREGKPSRMSFVGPKHGFPPEAAEFWIGTPVSPVDATLRAHLAELPADSGLIVNDVVAGSPADQVSVKKNDILVAMDGKPLTNADSLIAQIQASQGKPVPLQILRAGKPLTLMITPAKRTHPTVINARKTPEMQFSVQLVRPNMAIEVGPTQAKSATAGSYTLYAPYSGLMHDPYSGAKAQPGAFGEFISPTPLSPTFNYYGPPHSEAHANRIEGQLREINAKLDVITKALEALKPAAAK